MRDNKLHNQKGFTMAELLIVVAIIAVLVAVAIPVFNKKLEKAREAYDIATMRQAASAAIDLYYAGVHDETSAHSNGMGWWPPGSNSTADNCNAFGAYNPATGKFEDDKAKVKAYGKGTGENAKTTFVMGNTNGAYASNQDYRDAVVMVSIYPYGSNPHVMVYWKNNTGAINGKNNQYVGGAEGTSNPKYSIRIDLN